MSPTSVISTALTFCTFALSSPLRVATTPRGRGTFLAHLDGNDPFLRRSTPGCRDAVRHMVWSRAPSKSSRLGRGAVSLTGRGGTLSDPPLRGQRGRGSGPSNYRDYGGQKHDHSSVTDKNGNNDNGKTLKNQKTDATARLKYTQSLNNLRINEKIFAAKEVESLLAVTTANIETMNRMNVAAAYKRLSEITQSFRRGGKRVLDPDEQEQWLKVTNIAKVLAENDLLAPKEIAQLVAAMRGPGKHGLEPRADRKLVHALQQSATNQIHKFEPKNIAHFLVGLVQLRIRPEREFLEALDQRLKATMERCRPHVAANLLWSLRKLESTPSPQLMKSLANRVSHHSRDSSIRVKLLARCVWALSGCESEYSCVVGDPDWSKEMVSELLDAMKFRISSTEKLEASDIAHTIWAFAKVSVQDSEFTQVVKARVLYNLGDFEAYDVANVVWALAKLQCESPKGELIEALASRAAEQGPMFQPQGLSNCLWGMATLQYEPSSEFVKSTKRYMSQEGSKFDAQSISNTLWAYAKLKMKPDLPEVVQIERSVVRASSNFIPQEVSMTFWSLAHLNVHPSDETLDSLEEPLQNTVPRMEPQGLANTLWAHATLQIQPSQSVSESLVARMTSISEQFTSQALSNSLWSMARLNWGANQQGVDVLYAQTMSRLESFSELEFTNALWALAKLQYPISEEARLTLQANILSRASLFTPQSLVTSLWAAVKLQDQGFSDELIQGIQDEMLRREEGFFTAQSVANTLWSFAKFRFTPRSELLMKIQRDIPSQLEHFNAQEISNSFWAFAKLSITPDDTVMIGLQRQMVEKNQEFTSQGVSNVLWSFAKLAFVMIDEAFMETIEARVCAIVTKFTPQEIANTIWAYGRMRLQPSRDILSLLSKQATKNIEDWKPEEISGLLWGFVKLSRRPDDDLAHWIQRQAVHTSDSFTDKGRGVVVWALEQLDVPFIEDMLHHFIPEAEYDADSDYYIGSNEITPFQDPDQKEAGDDTEVNINSRDTPAPGGA
mmetsp:Transcript_18929/g.26357  ORF Transcript_18929/g.26357 Transcript_18929/m.26357 type:complete len:1009 (+) Transcript_18929:133-3159(+)|eukprot:CAMPEP_0184481866 /NCGR_PEP_ID=MMETSP0113_2-20130426/3449_1 /TAXON_ID=91329 /ORGANISM="Norrisiella sphaerica, Strain BC52" /LENGTH=1008 /DNA_ID=CAMNT_0026861277 /DNA_START=74 /DNA_END=3100 /DNA_ORIENTATION=-